MARPALDQHSFWVGQRVQWADDDVVLPDWHGRGGVVLRVTDIDVAVLTDDFGGATYVLHLPTEVLVPAFADVPVFADLDDAQRWLDAHGLPDPLRTGDNRNA